MAAGTHLQNFAPTLDALEADRELTSRLKEVYCFTASWIIECRISELVGRGMEAHTKFRNSIFEDDVLEASQALTYRSKECRESRLSLACTKLLTSWDTTSRSLARKASLI